jgi:hypothetical protein
VWIESNPVISLNCYPNPFNLQTKIEVNFPLLELANISIYDILGRKVNTLFNGYPADRKINVTFNATPSLYGSGIYFAVANQNQHKAIIRLSLIK